MKVIVIIPSRLGSTRLPRKALADIGGFTLIQQVYKRVHTLEGIDQLLVATDSQEIIDSVAAVGGKAVMTSAEHISGTDRIAEALTHCDHSLDDIVINLQGDEPLVSLQAVSDLIDKMTQEEVQIATLVRRMDAKEERDNPNVVKVVKAENGMALYFSRAKIPYVRDAAATAYYQHIGVYAFKAKILLDLVNLPSSPLEKTEKLEQLRWLENGYQIHTVTTEDKSIGVDTAEDLEKVRNIIESRL